jgi:5-formyltetrahydrofolate cyclo-ligase
MVVPPTALDLLRKELRKKRQTIAKQCKYDSFATPDALEDLLRRATVIGLYLPMGGEPDPRPLATGHTAKTALPALSKDSSMVFQRWCPGDPLMRSSWSGQQPPHSAPIVIPDLIIVPLLGFDRSLNRIGQGGGHYDRYLAANPAACRIGFAWEGQRTEKIDAQPWDVPLDAILTETSFYVKDLSRCQRP